MNVVGFGQGGGGGGGRKGIVGRGPAGPKSIQFFIHYSFTFLFSACAQGPVGDRYLDSKVSETDLAAVLMELTLGVEPDAPLQYSISQPLQQDLYGLFRSTSGWASWRKWPFQDR